MDYDPSPNRKMLGSGGVIIMDEDTYMVKVALRTMKFYQHESCGWCIPCREGTDLAEENSDAIPRIGGIQRHRYLIGESCKEHVGPHFLPAGRCGRPADYSIVEKFRHEFETH